MASDPKTGLEEATSKDTAKLILDFRGSPAEFWADNFVKDFYFGTIGDRLNARYASNNNRHTVSKTSVFSGVRVHFTIRSAIDRDGVNRPRLEARQWCHCAYNSSDPQFCEKIDEHNAEMGLDLDDPVDAENRIDELPPSRYDKFVGGCRFVEIDSSLELFLWPRFTGSPGQEEDFRLYDYRSCLIEVFKRLTQPNIRCQVPGCGKLAIDEKLGGYCSSCVNIVGPPCVVCGRSFGFQELKCNKHTFCIHEWKPDSDM